MNKLTAPSQTPPQDLPADWEGLRTFAAFVESGSFSGAARMLGVTHATVSRRLQMLEHALQGPLFTRRGDDTELTRLGETVLGAARAMQAQTAQLARRLAGEDIRMEGKVRIASTDALATMFLAPRLPSLLDQWPNLDVEFSMSHHTVSLARRDADLAIRFARPQDGDLIARRLGKISYFLCGSKARVDDWRRNPASTAFIGYDDGVPEIPETLWLADHAGNNPVRFRSTSLVAQCVAARAGVGLALLPHYLLAPDLELAEAASQLQREVWVVYHRDLKSLPRLRAVLDWLEGCFSAQA
ncbi:LysR family transcriptional regulator [Herbaspirillum rhizosphaerae]|uniref:LysR family transcriptional regulator n=1 Tax=Herbaspirillum rhizosphaerae TaxID=346179 RepID=UPI000A6EF19F|nr:LysR family transcriptional regulator [Herbaspirillum rhizosphaerae]